MKRVVASSIEAAVLLPLLAIADATARRVTAAGHRTVGLLGTRFTMERLQAPSLGMARTAGTKMRGS